MDDEMARRLRAARGYGKLSQPGLAAALEISEGTMKNIELGKRSPKRSELLAIAEACDVPMWFLEGGWEGRREEIDDAADVQRKGEAAKAQLDRAAARRRAS